jgi:hypothetical protein
VRPKLEKINIPRAGSFLADPSRAVIIKREFKDI